MQHCDTCFQALLQKTCSFKVQERDTPPANRGEYKGPEFLIVGIDISSHLCVHGKLRATCYQNVYIFYAGRLELNEFTLT